MTRRRRKTIGDGDLLRLLAVAHTTVGLGVYRAELRSIGRSRVFASVPYRGPRATAFWFLVPSPLMWIIGRLVGDAEHAGRWDAVRAAHRVSLMSAAVAIVCMPISGFWGWLALSARGLRRRT
jgi:hypothetical protein